MTLIFEIGNVKLQYMNQYTNVTGPAYRIASLAKQYWYNQSNIVIYKKYTVVYFKPLRFKRMHVKPLIYTYTYACKAFGTTRKRHEYKT